MSTAFFDDQARFVIPDYTQTPPFASFLPGIAGRSGIPMWVFYVNRGQAIASFGVASKDTPIVEFEPANKAYRNVAHTGFRTFITLNGAYYEPFGALTGAESVQRRMHIGTNELELQEFSPLRALRVTVRYFTLTGEPFAGLVRQVTFANEGTTAADLRVLDGLPAIMPFGVTNTILKELSRTAEAWMGVSNLAQQVPFYRLRSSIVDKVEVEGYAAGHFYTAFDAHGRLPAIVDPDVIFGANTSLSQPDHFLALGLDDLLTREQITVGKTPCGFFAAERTLSPGADWTLYSVVGHVNSLDVLQRHSARISDPTYITGQHQAARTLVRALTDHVAVQTSEPRFDAYTRQTFLDNVLRGGWPVLIGAEDRPVVQHIYSRKHGDLERDYNAFYLAPEYYSQGNGNYRDVNQNRREDVWLNPRVGAYNIQAFMNLLQADGYNPLVIDGNRFTVPPEHHAAILAYVDQPAPLIAFLQSPFTPGALLNFIEAAEVGLRISPESFLAQVLHDADRDFIAEPGEGYWIDHWTYNLDLIENYLAIYPETQTSLLFETPAYTFYDNPHVVQPRARKTFLAGERVRQLDAVIYDHEKAALIAARSRAPNIMRAAHGRGEIFTTTLFAKLVTLAVVKFATRDPYGMGIEMEAGKPGWYDALNGLPGLFGASMPETFELVRLLAFLRAVIQAQDPARGVTLPVELHDLLHAIAHTLEQHSGDTFAYWDAISTARETYRAQIRLGFEGITHASTLDELDAHFAAFERRLQAGIARAAAMNEGIPPTYIVYTAERYEIIDSVPHTPERQPVRVTAFVPQVLPLFLEGPVRALKIAPDLAAAQKLHTQVRESALFDRALQMYKVNAPLADQPLDIGRARAFTPGWLENESIWLHMAYKYLLALLKAGLYDAFYADFKSSLVPFLDPAIYGRSPLENSSFIVSSAHPDTSLHGRGFVARLSGSTAEFLSILHHIMAGPQPFALHQGDLILQFQPVLPGWLFDAAGEVHFTFLGHTRVTYVNPARCDTFGPDAVTIQQIELTGTDRRRIAFTGEVIGAPHAQNVRAGRVKAIRITLA